MKKLLAFSLISLISFNSSNLVNAGETNTDSLNFESRITSHCDNKSINVQSPVIIGDYTVSGEKYGKIFYDNLGTVSATVTLYKIVNGSTSSAGSFSIDSNKNRTLLFSNLSDGTYTIKISNNGTEKLNGKISFKTDTSDFSNKIYN